MRTGTLGSIAGAGDPPGPTIQALLIARPRLSRALWTSWSKIVVALKRKPTHCIRSIRVGNRSVAVVLVICRAPITGLIASLLNSSRQRRTRTWTRLELS